MSEAEQIPYAFIVRVLEELCKKTGIGIQISIENVAVSDRESNELPNVFHFNASIDVKHPSRTYNNQEKYKLDLQVNHLEKMKETKISRYVLKDPFIYPIQIGSFQDFIKQVFCDSKININAYIKDRLNIEESDRQKNKNIIIGKYTTFESKIH